MPFSSESRNYQHLPETDHDPFNRDMVGPRSCEYCGESSTLNCGNDCDRPKLFFLKKRPPFESTDGWDHETEYRLDPFGRMEAKVGVEVEMLEGASSPLEKDINSVHTNESQPRSALFAFFSSP